MKPQQSSSSKLKAESSVVKDKKKPKKTNPAAGKTGGLGSLLNRSVVDTDDPLFPLSSSRPPPPFPDFIVNTALPGKRNNARHVILTYSKTNWVSAE
jgi:hypothetical protein